MKLLWQIADCKAISSRMNDYEKEQLGKISKLCSNISAENIHKLDNLAAGFSYMREPRMIMMAQFERFNSLKTHRKKLEAWERVTDQVERIHTIASSAIFCSKPKD